MTQKGCFIVIEGIDGSGKGTQFSLLKNRLVEAGYDVETFDFPQYDNPSSYFVKEYLNGRYGAANEIGPYTASFFYALDRFEAAAKIQAALDAGKVVLANRFTGSSMAHQGTKFQSAEERRGFFIWLDNLEFGMLRIPRPTTSIILRVPALIAQELIDHKTSRSYTDKKRDIHEADLKHLERASEVYDDLACLFPKDFQMIDCNRNHALLSVEVIHELMWGKVSPLLPQVQKLKSEPGTTTDNTSFTPALNPYVIKESKTTKISKAGYEYLSEIMTNVSDDIYAFNEKLSTTTIAAAMARLSRRNDDMRITLLDEFTASLHKDNELLSRVITAYGDDSVQQLTGIHLVVEKASNLLTKKLEWGRLAAYLEQSTRYIYFDRRDERGRFKYYVPEYLDEGTKKLYESSMDQIFGLYSSIVHSLTDYIQKASTVPRAERDGSWRNATRAQACDAARGVLPVATESTVGIFASAQALESLIIHLLSDELPEARHAGQIILEEARKVIPSFLERTDKPDRGGAMVAYRSSTRRDIQKLAEKYLPSSYADDGYGPELVSVWPRNELDLVPDMLYEFSNQPLKTIRAEVDTWPYDRKVEVLQAYVGDRLNRRQRPGRALEKAHYSWDIICDYGIFRDLQRHRIVDDLQWQNLSPRYGFEVPALIEEAGLTEDYERCFDLSLGLYSHLQKASYSNEAQYATLLGHRMRWKVTYNAREAFHIHELRTSPQGHPGYRKLVLAMHEQLARVHPLLAAQMRFVNQSDDPELTRLAAERYSQFKLSQIESRKKR